MQKLSDGTQSTLGNYKRLSIIFSKKAQDYIQKKIEESPKGEDEEVIAPESQMIMMLGSMQDELESVTLTAE